VPDSVRIRFVEEIVPEATVTVRLLQSPRQLHPAQARALLCVAALVSLLPWQLKLAFLSTRL
jgi:hypothetical protein